MTLWEAIDNWMVTNLAARMGAASAYATLKLASYHDEILTVPQQWADLKFPAAFVESTSADVLTAEMDIGTPNDNLSYRYGIAIVTLSDTKKQAKNDGREMAARLRQFLYYTYLELPKLATVSGETVEDVVIGSTFVRPIPATKGDKWYGFALVGFNVRVHSRSI